MYFVLMIILILLIGTLIFITIDSVIHKHDWILIKEGEITREKNFYNGSRYTQDEVMGHFRNYECSICKKCKIEKMM